MRVDLSRWVASVQPIHSALRSATSCYRCDCVYACLLLCIDTWSVTPLQMQAGCALTWLAETGLQTTCIIYFTVWNNITWNAQIRLSKGAHILEGEVVMQIALWVMW